ncbi:ATP-binding cassette domain-containing protein [Helcococcus kunzii]|uniref:ATP-binding cassette domain-containing protein n=1 Tax=Helcococcus kunzii TaxID=40091 RepID=UPI00389E2D6D
MKIINMLNKKILVLYIILAVLMSFDNLVLPMAVENIIKAAESSDVNRLKYVVIISTLTWILSKTLSYLFNRNKHKLSENYQITMKSKLYNAFINLNISPESFQNIIYKDINLIEENYLNSIFGVIVCVFLSSISLVYMFQLDFYLSLVFIIMAIFPVIFSGVFDKKIISLGEIVSINNEKYIKDINENIKGIQILKYYQRKDYFKEKNFTILNNLENSNFKKKELLSRVTMYVLIIYGFSYILPIGYGAYRIIQGKSTVAALIGIYLIADKAISPLTSIASYFNSMKSVKTIKDKLTKTIEQSIELENANIGSEIEDIVTLELNSVGIGYGFELFNISEVISKGEKILLIGDSGSGKSSLFKTLFKEIPLLSGSIRINGMDISKIEKKSLYKKIGYIPQEIIIFDETVKFNVTLGENFSDEEVIYVLNSAGFNRYDLDNFIRKEAGDSGKNLSGGEKARICVARALIRNYNILLIDEFSAALDKNVTKEIRRLLLDMDITIIEIAHHYDKSDIKLFDKIYEIKNKKFLVK